MATDLVEGAVAQIMRAISEREFVPGDALPREPDLATWLDVSRPTMREAIRILSERGVVRVVHGRGTYIEDPQEWTDLGSIIEWLSHAVSAQEMGTYLIELRRMIEVGGSGLAAERRENSDLDAMHTALAEYETLVEQGLLDKAAQADLRFHQHILEASKNPLLAAVMQPLATPLEESRRLTTEVPEIRERAREHHHHILAAIEAGDAQRAKDAMRAHMDQTSEDIHSHLPGATAPSAH